MMSPSIKGEYTCMDDGEGDTPKLRMSGAMMASTLSRSDSRIVLDCNGSSSFFIFLLFLLGEVSIVGECASQNFNKGTSEEGVVASKEGVLTGSCICSGDALSPLPTMTLACLGSSIL